MCLAMGEPANVNQVAKYYHFINFKKETHTIEEASKSERREDLKRGEGRNTCKEISNSVDLAFL